MEVHRCGGTKSPHTVQFGEVWVWPVSTSLISCVTFILVFSFTAAAGDVCSCQQYDRCNRCPSSGPCTRINVALAKPVSVSSILNNTQKVSGPGCLAVNGHRTTTSMFVKDSPACFATDFKDKFPYWEVDLGQNYPISTITVFTHSNGRRKWLMDANITVDNGLCYTFAPDYPDIVYITCNSPLTGRKVRIERSNRTDIAFLTVCQVQVWVCINGSYGPNCSKTCGNCTNEAACHPITGKCSRGCKPGYHGLYCSDRCSPRTYGKNCQEICGNCRANTTCRQTDGMCEAGCAGDYTDNFCKTTDHESARGVSWTHLVAGAIVGGVALGAVVIGFVLGICFTRCRQRQRQEEGHFTEFFSLPLQTVCQNVRVPPDASGKLEVLHNYYEDNEDPVYANST